MKGDECRPAPDEALLLAEAFLRAALAASAAAIDMSNGGGHEEDDVVGDGSFIDGDDGPKPDETGNSSLPNQDLLPSDDPANANFSCEVGDRSAGGRILTSSFDDELLVGLKSGSNLTIGGRSSDWFGFTGSNDPGRGPTRGSGGLGEPLLSFSSGVPSLDATPLAKAAMLVVAGTERVEEGALVSPAAEVCTTEEEEDEEAATADSLGAAVSCSPVAGGLASELLPAGISGEEVREPPPADTEPALRVSLGSRS